MPDTLHWKVAGTGGVGRHVPFGLILRTDSWEPRLSPTAPELHTRVHRSGPDAGAGIAGGRSSGRTGIAVIVVDASALIEVLTRSIGQRVESRIMRASESIHVPALIDLEVAHVLRRYASTRQVPAHWAPMALDIAIAFPMTRYLHEPLMKRVWELRGNLTAYDAAYVALGAAPARSTRHL